ncbi:MAG: hypothetical protein ACFFC7_18720 [Candidatus Hermodarchaeota archaeon]
MTSELKEQPLEGLGVRLECQNQVRDHDNELFFFCLVFKEFFSECSAHCPYFVQGETLSMQTVFEQNIDLECPHFFLLTQQSSPDSPWFICGKTADSPECKSCPLKDNLI